MSNMETENREAMEKVWELLPVQMQNLYYQSYAPQSNFFNIHNVVKLSPEVDQKRMEDAVNSVLKNHPALNLRIFRDEATGEYRQQYDGSFAAPVQTRSLREDELGKVLEEINAPFRVENTRLYRCGLLRTEEGLYLYIVIHHIISDGSSCALLMNQIMQSYEKGSFAGEPDYYFYLLKQTADRRKAEGYREAKAYFSELFDQAIKEGVPVGLAPDHKSDGRSMMVSMKALERKENQNVNFLKTAALIASAWYNQKDFAFLQTIYGDRFTKERENAGGILAAAITIGLRFKGDEDPSELLAEVQRQNSFAREHTEYSYIADRIKDPSLMLRFNYLKDNINWFSENEHLGKPVRLPESDTVAGAIGLTFMESVKNNKLMLVIRYAKECYEKESIDRFIELFGKAVEYLEQGK